MLRSIKSTCVFQSRSLHLFHRICRKSELKDSDFFGIKSLTATDISGEKLAKDDDQVTKKYEFVKEKRNLLDNEEQIHLTSFGSVRYDSMNRPKYHGQFDAENEKVTFDNDQLQSVFSLYDNENKNQQNYQQEDKPASDENEQISTNTKHVYKPKIQIIDLPVNDYSNIDKSLFAEKHQSNHGPEIINNQFCFTQAWKQWISDDMEYKSQIYKRNFINKETDVSKNENSNENSNLFAPVSPLRNFNEIKQELDEIQKENLHKTNDEDETIEQESLKELLKEPPMAKPQTQKINAFKYAQEIKEKLTRSKKFETNLDCKYDAKIKLDSKGLNVYSDQVLNLFKLNRADLLLHLESLILINDDNLVALNKPYGLICPGEHKSEGKGLKLNDIIDDFANLVLKLNSNQTDGQTDQTKTSKLYPVHRLDRDTTGVLLFAKNVDTAKKLHELFRDHKIIKKYLCITKNVPEPHQGIVDIPLEDRSVDGKQRMELAPKIIEEYRQVVKPSVNAKRAVTEYKVISQNGNACLVQMNPLTGVKHQLRAHMGLALRAPILGDHKYSYLDKIVPQKLPSDMLQLLRVRQSKVRTIPMHLHCLQMILPGLGRSGNDLYIKAKLPSYFMQNLYMLKLKL